MSHVLENDYKKALRKEKNSNALWKRIKKEFPFGVGSTPFIFQLFFFYLPLFLLLTSSFLKLSKSGQFEGVTLEYFKAILKPAYFSVILNSATLAAFNTLICLLVGFTLAYSIVFHSGRMKNFLLFLLIIPFWTNFILHIYAWFFVLEKHGFINNLLLQLGWIENPVQFLYSNFAIFLMMVYFYLPFMVMPIFSTLERFDHSLLEASMDLGASKAQTIRRILIPVSMNAIRSGIFLVFIPSFGEFVIPELMGGAKDLYIGNVISLFIMDHKTAPLAIAFTVVSILALIVSIFIIQWMIHKTTKILVGGSG
jgi:ABC-type spermidine/putrescine transport system permease subunit I